MRTKEYKWDISLLYRMKQSLQDASLSERQYCDIDSAIIDELLCLCSNRCLKETHSLEARLLKVRENNQYVCEQISQNQDFYLKQLRKEFDYILPFDKTGRTDFTVEELLELLQDFINWFPSKKLAQFLKVYYERDFPTHFFYCQNGRLFPYRGTVYQFHYFISPFMIVTKETFIETFITLVHEIGHVLSCLLDLKYSKSKCESLFFELDGRYFEELARQFLREKNIYMDEEKKSSIQSYNDIVKFSRKIKTSNIPQTFFTYLSVEEMLCEIYSYLGSLELLDKHHGDYEKQLYDLVHLLETPSDNIESYLLNAGFHWREDDFKILRKKRADLEKYQRKCI